MIRNKLLAVAVLALSVASASAKNAKISTDLEGGDPAASVDVIVQFSQVPTARHHQKVFARGGTLQAELKSVKAGAYRLPAAALDSLANDPEVVHISADHKLGALLDNSAAAVNASAAWQTGLDGSGIGVAVIDSGISAHDDLKNSKGASRIVYSQSFVQGDANDHFGHGEHVAGIVGGDGLDSSCAPCTRLLKGIAPNVNLINLRVLDQNGQGTDSGVIAAIEQAINLKSKYNIRVINLSLGRPVFESYTVDPLCQAVEAAWKAGIVVVVAAGNEGRNNSMGTSGYATVTAPGNDPYVITVGAMKTMGTPSRNDDLIASYSSKGPTSIDQVVKPDIVAPGNRVVSLLPAGSTTLPSSFPQTLISGLYYGPGPANSTKYYMLNGTSMATPVVSGAAADLLQSQPALTPDQVKARLMKTAYKAFPSTSVATDPVTGQVYVDQYDIFTVGAGYLDVQAALSDTSLATGTALSPTASYDPTTGNVYLVTDSSSVWDNRSMWGYQSVWGVRSVWGTSVFLTGSQALWGTQSVWGTRSLWGYSSIWGTRSVWGTTTTDATEATSVVINGEN